MYPKQSAPTYLCVRVWFFFPLRSRFLMRLIRHSGMVKRSGVRGRVDDAALHAVIMLEPFLLWMKLPITLHGTNLIFSYHRNGCLALSAGGWMMGDKTLTQSIRSTHCDTDLTHRWKIHEQPWKPVRMKIPISPVIIFKWGSDKWLRMQLCNAALVRAEGDRKPASAVLAAAGTPHSGEEKMRSL